MHMAAFSTRTCLLVPLSSFPPFPPLTPPLNAITRAASLRAISAPPTSPPPPRGLWTDFGNLAQSRGWPPFWSL
jgi:hypothetical protein